MITSIEQIKPGMLVKCIPNAGDAEEFGITLPILAIVTGVRPELMEISVYPYFSKALNEEIANSAAERDFEYPEDGIVTLTVETAEQLQLMTILSETTIWELLQRFLPINIEAL